MTIEIIEIDGEFIADGRQAYQEGVAACKVDRNSKANPYEAGSYLALQWGKGFANEFYWSQFNTKQEGGADEQAGND